MKLFSIYTEEGIKELYSKIAQPLIDAGIYTEEEMLESIDEVIENLRREKSTNTTEEG